MWNSFEELENALRCSECIWNQGGRHQNFNKEKLSEIIAM